MAAVATMVAMRTVKFGFQIRRSFAYMRNAKMNSLETPTISINDQKFEWYVLDDVVMGGISASLVSLNGQGSLVHSGNISPIGGGFATCRIKNVDLGITEANKGLRITFIGNTNTKVHSKFTLSMKGQRMNW